MARLSELLVEVRDAAARFEADRWSGEDCARLAEELARTAKACAAASGGLPHGRWRVAAVMRSGWPVGGCDAGPGARGVGDHGGVVGVSGNQRRRPSGSVSLAQARGSCGRRPRCRVRRPACWRSRASQGMAGLREEAAGAGRAQDVVATSCTAGRSRPGRCVVGSMVRGWWRASSVWRPRWVPFVNRLDAETDRVRRAARKQGSIEAREAHAADSAAAIGEGWRERSCGPGGCRVRV